MLAPADANKTLNGPNHTDTGKIHIIPCTTFAVAGVAPLVKAPV